MSLFDYEPITAEQAKKDREFPLLRESEYMFEVVDAKSEYSHAGNPQVVVKLKINFENRDYFIYDYFVNTERMRWKLRHFCLSIGLENEYNNKTFLQHCVGKTGDAKIKTQAGNLKPDGQSYYPDKNVVVDYIVNDNADIKLNYQTAKVSGSTFKDSEISF